jgi:NitT/TauT family transport system permease protein
MRTIRRFEIKQPIYRPVTWGDVLVFVGIALLLYLGARLAFAAPAIVRGPGITLSPEVLPWYAALSVRRMATAYVLSLLFALIYGRTALRSKRAERVLLPILDILQSIPILSFLPVVLLSLSAILPPLELPFARIGLIWNSIMSWAGGWFFLMTTEIFTVGERDFRLPGLGAFLQQVARQGDLKAVAWGISTLVLVIVLLDQFLWQPLLAWADRFKLEIVESDNPPTS